VSPGPAHCECACIPDHSVEVDTPTAIATPISPEVSTYPISFPASPTETATTSTLPEAVPNTAVPPPVVDSSTVPEASRKTYPTRARAPVDRFEPKW
jgi:hypothetical protein